MKYFVDHFLLKKKHRKILYALLENPNISDYAIDRISKSEFNIKKYLIFSGLVSDEIIIKMIKEETNNYIPYFFGTFLFEKDVLKFNDNVKEAFKQDAKIKFKKYLMENRYISVYAFRSLGKNNLFNEEDLFEIINCSNTTAKVKEIAFTTIVKIRDLDAFW